MATISNTSTSISQYSLQNGDNYYNEIHGTMDDILNKYKMLIFEYLSFIMENIAIKKKHTSYHTFIIMRGLDTITHVFINMLYYSKNVDMAYYHGQKSFYFYVEFVCQISDDSHSFLQLTSRDATIFVYKKTIFEMIKKDKNTTSNVQDILKINILENHVKFIKNMIFFLINNNDFALPQTKYIITKMDNILQYFNNNYSKPNIYVYNIIHFFIETITSNDLIFVNDYNNESYFMLMEAFLKKYLKKPHSQDSDAKIKNKLSGATIAIKLQEGHTKFINWLLL